MTDFRDSEFSKKSYDQQPVLPHGESESLGGEDVFQGNQLYRNNPDETTSGDEWRHLHELQEEADQTPANEDAVTAYPESPPDPTISNVAEATSDSLAALASASELSDPNKTTLNDLSPGENSVTEKVHELIGGAPNT